MNTDTKSIIMLLATLSLTACSYMYQEPGSSTNKGVATITAETSMFASQESVIKEIDGKIASFGNPFGNLMSYNITPGNHRILVVTEFKTAWYNMYVSNVTLNMNIKANHHYTVKSQVNGETLLVWAVDQNGRPASAVVRDVTYKARGLKPEDISYINQIANIH